MIELKDDGLVFTFPEVHASARLVVAFQRTLRCSEIHAKPSRIASSSLLSSDLSLSLSVSSAARHSVTNQGLSCGASTVPVARRVMGRVTAKIATPSKPSQRPRVSFLEFMRFTVL